MAKKLPRRTWPYLGALGGGLALYWVLRDIEPDRLLSIIFGANTIPLLLLQMFILLEQVLRAVKWRQRLYSFLSAGTWRLFGVIMIGQLTTLLAPLGVSLPGARMADPASPPIWLHRKRSLCLTKREIAVALVRP